MKTTKHYVGLDVHKDTLTIAVADQGRNGEVCIYGRISSDLNVLESIGLIRALGDILACLSL
jgi:transposase